MKEVKKIKVVDPETGQSTYQERFVENSDNPVSERTYYEETTSNYNWGKAAVIDILAIIEILLLARFLLLLFGAHLTTFTKIVYSASELFVVPFRGLFASPTFGTLHFSAATLAAMIFWALVAWAIIAIIDVVRNRSNRSVRCIGPNCPVVR